MAFRLETAYGDPQAIPAAEEVVAYVDWVRRERRSQRERRRDQRYLERTGMVRAPASARH